jgi:nucleotide-binding universal stress UspA family protein
MGPEEVPMFRRILVSTDGTTRSARAVRTAAALARTCGASLTIFHAIPAYRTPYYPEGVGFDWPPESQYLKDSAQEAQKLLAKARALAAKEGVAATTAHVHDDETATAIVAAAAKAKCDLVVMASHGRKGLEKLLIGSETQRVLARTKIPVLVVR